MKVTDDVIISVDIANDSVRAVKGLKKEGKIHVLDFTCLALSSGEAAPDVVARLLTSMAGKKKNRIHSLISGRKLCIRVIQLPVMPRQELPQAIRAAIHKYISPGIEQIAFSFSVLGDVPGKDIRKQEIVFAAIQKDLLKEHLQFFRLARVEPTAITSACFSGWHLIRETGLDRGLASLMLVDIESQETNLTVYKEGQFVFTRNISLGEKDFSDIIRNQARLSLDSVKEIKSLWTAAAAANTEKSDIAKAGELLRNEAEVLCKEIELTVNHYYQMSHGEKIDKCIVLGDGLRAVGLVDFLKQKLEIPLEALRIPETKLELPRNKREEFEENEYLYTQALGALLIGPDDINLLAQTGPRARKAAFSMKYPALSKMTSTAILVFIFVGAMLLVIFKGANLYYKYQIRSYRTRQDKLQNQTMQLTQIRRKIDILDFKKRLYIRLLKERPDYPFIIGEICRAIPSEQVSLEELKFFAEQRTNRISGAPAQLKFTLGGKVSGQEATAALVTKFVLALEQSGYFDNLSVAIKENALPANMRVERDLSREQASEGGKVELSFTIDGIVRLKD